MRKNVENRKKNASKVMILVLAAALIGTCVGMGLKVANKPVKSGNSGEMVENSTEEVASTEEIAETTEEITTEIIETTEEVVEKDNSVTASLSRVDTGNSGAAGNEESVSPKPAKTDNNISSSDSNVVNSSTTEAVTETPATEVPTTEASTTEAPSAETPTTENTDPSYGDLVWVVDREARWVEIPVYETRLRAVCNNCGADITANIDAHFTHENTFNGCGGWHDDYYTVQTGTQWVYEEEQGHLLMC